jgi:hypothetical protein
MVISSSKAVMQWFFRRDGTAFRRISILALLSSLAGLGLALEKASFGALTLLASKQSARAEGPQQARIEDLFAKLPMRFEANRGQTAGEVRFLARGTGYALFLTDDEAVLELQRAEGRGQKAVASSSPTLLRMRLLGSNPHKAPTGIDELPGKSNYIIGDDPGKWHTNVPAYARARYASVYSGVDLAYYGNQGRLEYDFVVAPGADPSTITLELRDGLGAREGVPLRIDRDGDLLVATSGGEVRFRKPLVYQEGSTVHDRQLPAKRLTSDSGLRPAGDKLFLGGRYVLKGGGQVGFEVAAYDKRRPLVIDPVLLFSTHLGGSSSDSGRAIALDSLGNVYVTGSTTSTNFPVPNPGAFQTGCTLNAGNCAGDVFVTKVMADGSALGYSTYVGGTAGDFGLGIAVDSSGNAYVTGQTTSTDFPVWPKPGAFQTVCGDFTGSCGDGFVFKLKADGTQLLYSTYLGGNGSDEGEAIAIDPFGNAYVTGQTSSSNFPTMHPLSTALQGGVDAFVTQVNPAGTGLVYSTYLGGTGADFGFGIAVDSSRNAYVTGETRSTDFPTTVGALQTACGVDSSNRCEGDAFVTKLNFTGSTLSLVYSTYLGGSAEDFGDGIVVDASNNAYVTGGTNSPNFPVVNAFQSSFQGGVDDAFVAKLNPSGSALVFSTYLGGNDYDSAQSIALGASGVVYVTGSTSSGSFPTSNALLGGNALHAGNCSGGPCRDAFVAKFDSSGAGLIFSTYLGGSLEDNGNSIAVDSSGNAYVTGRTQSSDFPVMHPTPGSCLGTCGGAGNDDAFVAKIGSLTTPFASFSGASVSFGSQNIGTTSALQTVTVTNTGDASLTVASVVLGGTNPTDFTLASNSCVMASPIAPGGTCTVTAKFAPVAAGSLSATLTLTDNSAFGSAGGMQVINLTGNGVPVVMLSPNSLNFGNQLVGTTSVPQVVTLATTGTLTVSSVAITAGYAETNNCVGAVTASCSINVTFAPTAAGLQSGTLTITDNGSGSPQMIPLTGTGTGIDFSISASPFSPSPIVAGQTATSNLTITPLGGFSQVVMLTCTGAPAGSNCTVSPSSVTPSGSPATATVSVVTTAIGTRQGAYVLTLTGTGAAGLTHSTTAALNVSLVGPAVSLTPSSVLFGGQNVGVASAPPATVTLTNPGTIALNITSISFTGANPGDFSQSGSTCSAGTPVAASGSCTIGVVITPQGSGLRSASLSISDNAPGSPQTVPLSGNGKDFAISLAPGSPNSVTVSHGMSATYTLSLAPLGGFDEQISVNCTGAPARSTCTSSPPSITLNGTSAQTVTVTAATQAPSMTVPWPKLKGPSPFSDVPVTPWLLAILALLMLPSLATAGGRRAWPRAWLGYAGAALLVLTWAGCGGGGSGGGGGGGGNPGTAAGTYALTITATGGSQTHNLTVKLIVQ